MVEEAAEVCLVYADDLTIAIAHAQAEPLVQKARAGDRHIQAALGHLPLGLGRPKCNNLVLSPGAIAGRVFRRGNGLSQPVSNELAMRYRRLEAHLESFGADALPSGVLPRDLRASDCASRIIKKMR